MNVTLDISAWFWFFLGVFSLVLVFSTSFYAKFSVQSRNLIRSSNFISHSIGSLCMLVIILLRHDLYIVGGQPCRSSSNPWTTSGRLCSLHGEFSIVSEYAW